MMKNLAILKKLRLLNISCGWCETDQATPLQKFYVLRAEMQTQVQNMLNKQIIRRSTSLWSAPAILVPKENQDGKLKFRFCVDFRALNLVTQFDPYPLPVF